MLWFMEVNVGHVVVALELIDVVEDVDVLLEVDVKFVEIHVNSIVEVEVLCLDTVLVEHLVFPLLINVLDVVAANHVEQLNVVENRAVDTDVLLVTLALLVLVKVEDVNVKLVLDVLIKIGVKAVFKVVDEVEVDDLVDVDELLLLEVLDEDVDEFVNALELIDVVEDVEVLLEVEVKVVEIHVDSIDEVEVLCPDAVLAEHLMFPLLVNVLDVVAVGQLDVVETRAVDADVLLVTLALLVLVDVGEVNVLDVEVEDDVLVFGDELANAVVGDVVSVLMDVAGSLCTAVEPIIVIVVWLANAFLGHIAAELHPLSATS
mmetsp:Transcript_46913/g.109389  ORF Transcript_46913/g.109389 Transcript_46913/m.109389 type:complete len:318 (-) Transcript_46913:309-1262(-)